MARPSEDETLPIQDLLADARAGTWKPVHVLVGTEGFLAERAVGLLKKATVGGGPRGFNDDVFHGAPGLSAQKIVSAARTLPMMASARFVLVRTVDGLPSEEQDALAAYVAAPSPSTCVVLVAEKIDGKTKLAKAAKAAGAWVPVDPLKGDLLRRFAGAEAKRRGSPLEPQALATLLDAVGADLAALDDAIERLSLYVGKGRPIDVAAVDAVVERSRVDTVWSLVDAIALRRTKIAMEAVGSLLADREEPLKILALVSRQVKMVAKAKDALDDGASGDEIAKAAGAPPWKSRELADAARKFKRADLFRAFALLSETDVLLKGSKRSRETILEEAVLRLCEARA